MQHILLSGLWTREIKQVLMFYSEQGQWEKTVKSFEEYVHVTTFFKKNFKYRHMFAMISAI